ncbi:MAG: hypothetical protein HYY18_02925 [Planctomycetes bacterium]|nr:hypothetical protein [Planctomycetota bacterium]
MKANGSAHKTSPAAEMAQLRRLIERVERNLNARIAQLQEELRASAPAGASAALRKRNERRARNGVARLQSDLRAQHARGVIDRQGRRIRKGWPDKELERRADVV